MMTRCAVGSGWTMYVPDGEESGLLNEKQKKNTREKQKRKRNTPRNDRSSGTVD